MQPADYDDVDGVTSVEKSSEVTGEQNQSRAAVGAETKFDELSSIACKRGVRKLPQNTKNDKYYIR